MHEAEGATFLLDAEPVRVVRSIRVLIYSRGGFVLEYFDDFVEYASRDGQILVSPGDMFNHRDLDRREVLIAEPSLLLFLPSQSHLIRLEDVEEKLLLLWLEEAVGIEGERIEAFLRKTFAGREVWRVGWERCEREEGINGDPAYISEVLGECGGDRSNLVGDLLVCESESGGIGRRERWQWARRRQCVVLGGAVGVGD